eukprot:scpid80420/ scgid0130/ 
MAIMIWPSYALSQGIVWARTSMYVEMALGATSSSKRSSMTYSSALVWSEFRMLLIAACKSIEADNSPCTVSGYSASIGNFNRRMKPQLIEHPFQDNRSTGSDCSCEVVPLS